jgi:hypothetical protein
MGKKVKVPKAFIPDPRVDTSPLHQWESVLARREAVTKEASEATREQAAPEQAARESGGGQ